MDRPPSPQWVPPEWTPDTKYEPQAVDGEDGPFGMPYGVYREARPLQMVPLMEREKLERVASNMSNASLAVGEPRRNGPTASLLIPTALVFCITAGFGVALLAWLLAHNTLNPRDTFREGAFLLDEGANVEGGLQAARLTGLTIASAASSAMGVIAPVSMGLYGFMVARSWLRLSAGNGANLPTALQYGLLVEMLGGGSIMNIAEAGMYLSRQARPKVPSMFVKVFIVGIGTHLLAYTAGALDLWLHSQTSTIIVTKAEFIDNPFQFSVAQNRCQPFVLPTAEYDWRYPCMVQADLGSWGYGIQTLISGMQVMANSSSTLQTITLADENDLAVLVDPSAPANVSFVSTSFGARTTCESVNHLCTDPKDDSVKNVTCTGYPPSFPPVDLAYVPYPEMDTLSSQVAVLSSGCGGCGHVSSMHYSDATLHYDNNGPYPENNYSLWLTLLWEGQGGVMFDGGSDDLNRDVAYTVFLGRAYILANCTMQFFNVTLGYENGAYRLLNAELSNSGLSDGLAGPTRAGLYGSRLLDDMQGIAFGENSVAQVMAYLNQDLARLALGSAANVTDLKGPTLTQSRLGQRILGRYPVAPALVYILVLWSNAVFPLVVAGIAMASRTTYVGVPGRGRAVTALELAKVRLTRPAALVAELFWSTKDGEYHRAKASASTDVAGMFEEQRTEDRVKIGLHERVDGQTVFGVWTRRRTAGDKETN